VGLNPKGISEVRGFRGGARAALEIECRRDGPAGIRREPPQSTVQQAVVL
jgi:hypothetical protein